MIRMATSTLPMSLFMGVPPKREKAAEQSLQ
jgi:hypothetical protein